MKRLHVHVSVKTWRTASASTRPCSRPSRPSPRPITPSGCWTIPANFAISERGQAKGLDHLGIQAENADELAELGQRLKAADLPHLAQPDSNCCYAKSDKHWSLDPSGIAWEAFHTLDTIPTYGEHGRAATEATATSCCSPVQQLTSTVAPKASTCC